MPRPCRCRRICAVPKYDMFVPHVAESAKPQCIPEKQSQNKAKNEIIKLRFDEYEVIRLIDLEKETQEQCAIQMDISRTTVAEIYESARAKLADSIVNGKRLIISGGSYRLCSGPQNASASCPYKLFFKKGEREMKIAVTYNNENGEIFQHFGHTEQFKIYDIEDGKVTHEQIVSADGFGHGALAGFLAGLNINILICGGIGGGAQAALADANIKLYGGVQGNADNAVQEFLNSSLSYDPDVHCNHHEEGHTCGHHDEDSNEHTCGHHDEDSHSCHCHN